MALVLVFIPRNFGIRAIYAKSVPKKRNTRNFVKNGEIAGKMKENRAGFTDNVFRLLNNIQKT